MYTYACICLQTHRVSSIFSLQWKWLCTQGCHWPAAADDDGASAISYDWPYVLK